MRERIFIRDVLQIYDSHSLRVNETSTRAISIQRITLSGLGSGISYKDVLTLVDVNPRASMAMARSSTSTSEPKTSGPTKGTMAPTSPEKAALRIQSA